MATRGTRAYFMERWGTSILWGGLVINAFAWRTHWQWTEGLVLVASLAWVGFYVVYVISRYRLRKASAGQFETRLVEWMDRPRKRATE